jgi:hypothetical protein
VSATFWSVTIMIGQCAASAGSISNRIFGRVSAGGSEGIIVSALIIQIRAAERPDGMEFRADLPLHGIISHDVPGIDMPPPDAALE